MANGKSEALDNTIAKEKGQWDQQWSTKNKYLQNITQKTKDRATRIPIKTWSELR
jgi:hypothetical protein